MKVEFFVPGQLVNPLNGSLSRAHWSKKSKWAGEWKKTARLAYMMSYPPADVIHPRVPKRVTFTAHVGGQWDDDNLPAGIKPVRDSLIGPLIHSDAPNSGHTFVYRQVIARKRRGVLVTVETA